MSACQRPQHAIEARSSAVALPGNVALEPGVEHGHAVAKAAHEAASAGCARLVASKRHVRKRWGCLLRKECSAAFASGIAVERDVEKPGATAESTQSTALGGYLITDW